VSDGKVIAIGERRAASPATLDDRTDDELMRLARGDHRDAFAALVARHMARLADFCTKMTCDRRTGEDVAQETWLQVWSHRGRYQPQGKFESFMFTIARNRCRNALRSRGRRGKLFVAGETERASDDPSHLDALLARERAARVADAVGELPPKLREAVLLRFSLGLDYPEISAIVGRGESTVRSRVFHGLQKLRGSLGQ
jgi:RNA polymerase sigma-70 factor (ECF subfamily)